MTEFTHHVLSLIEYIEYVDVLMQSTLILFDLDFQSVPPLHIDRPMKAEASVVHAMISAHPVWV